MKHFSESVATFPCLREALEKASAGNDSFALTEEEIVRLYPECKELCGQLGIRLLTVPSEDVKSLENLASVWKFLSDEGATRHSLLINIGGGSITDLGGFAAATFKRGIDYINIPTTLLAAADASIGGKTGIDFNGLKNEAGAFRMPLSTFVVPGMFTTLPRIEILSGLGEIIKTGFLDSCEAVLSALKLHPDKESIETVMGEAVERSARFKLRITESDPTEKGLRKILNLGHTAGHAFESLATGKGLNPTHGCAIAQGLLTSLILSHTLLGMDSVWINRLASLLREYYPPVRFNCDDYPELLSLMSHDKKNLCDSKIRFVLLNRPGEAQYDIAVEESDIKSALDITRDYLCI